MANKYEELFQSVNESTGDIKWLRDEGEDAVYGLGVAMVDGEPVAIGWITDGQCAYYAPSELDRVLAEYDEAVKSLSC